MIFAGLLDVISTEKVDVKLAKTLFVAPSITLSLTGTGGGLALSETVLRASAGTLLVTLGDEVKMQVSGSGIGNNGSPYDLGAEGAISSLHWRSR
ncbi:MAG: hypothetical protein H0X11_09395 [Betaproteobacteria bacterium]|nr:hypothetical protein [Betaproteobacteria bacterium]